MNFFLFTFKIREFEFFKAFEAIFEYFQLILEKKVGYDL